MGHLEQNRRAHDRWIRRLKMEPLAVEHFRFPTDPLLLGKPKGSQVFNVIFQDNNNIVVTRGVYTPEEIVCESWNDALYSLQHVFSGKDDLSVFADPEMVVWNHVAVVVMADGRTGIGVARQSERDQYNRSLGYRIAMGRALKNVVVKPDMVSSDLLAIVSRRELREELQLLALTALKDGK